MPREVLAPDAVQAALSQLDGWTLEDDAKAIRRKFEFSNFSEAFAFMTRVAMAAEKLNHHPDWSNAYRTVDVTLSTHDAGGLTELDFTLAGRMDRYAARR